MHLADEVPMDDVLFIIAPGYAQEEIDEEPSISEALKKKIKYVDSTQDDYVGDVYFWTRGGGYERVPESCFIDDVARVDDRDALQKMFDGFWIRSSYSPQGLGFRV